MTSLDTAADNWDHLFKVLIVGEAGVGKTSLLLKYTRDTFSKEAVSTLGQDFGSKMIDVQDKSVKLQIWDTAGQEKFRNITSSFYRGGHGIIIVYDICNSKTFQRVNDWYSEVRRWTLDNTPVYLVANKVDLSSSQQVATEVGKQFAKKLEIRYYETSAQSGQGVETVFADLAASMIKFRFDPTSKDDIISGDDLKKTGKIKKDKGKCSII